ncbi:MAG: hypothetical protein AAF330_06460 [Pseudomonadota bacterium]
MDDEIYKGGFYALVKRFESKHANSCDGAERYLPLPGCDLGDLKLQKTRAPRPEDGLESRSSLRYRHFTVATEFAGQSFLLYVHAMLIATLRRSEPPEHALTLFLRLWREEGRWLGSNLSTRWLIAAATTFGDRGETGAQRAVGMGLSVLFDSVKLHESERIHSGTDQLASRHGPHGVAPMPLDLEKYSMTKGDLDKNMLARLWLLAEQDSTIFPLARALLMKIMTDQGTVFARLQRIRAKIRPTPASLWRRAVALLSRH